MSVVVLGVGLIIAKLSGIKGQKKKTAVVSTLARMEITADFFFERGNQTA